jgi:anti-sigma B factor antagonist
MAELDLGSADVTVEVGEDRPGSALMVLAGELDISNVGEVREAVSGVCAKGPDLLIFDVSQLSFVDSAGLAALVGAARSVPVRLRSPSPVVSRVVELAGLGSVLPTE